VRRLAAELHGEQLEHRVEPDDELGALALDEPGDAVGERNGGDSGGVRRHGTPGYPRSTRRPLRRVCACHGGDDDVYLPV
jgi:hypothetical protein